METRSQTTGREGLRSNLFVVFCFVLLIGVVIYAVLTAQ
jgi:hypothetical protein